ncbi:hypothetical protein BDY21DRAFT_353935 [Lineolata rhizophorae]|uniref:Uncharacterized protein n=1 Tax=Lineolata rhizophorae TaxID=578093 RepID=A0A6A6NRC2_9PEZI|nr:hypothetical protein BDY21DRAFT_353935 [Lineolata rhizophorae]
MNSSTSFGNGKWPTTIAELVDNFMQKDSSSNFLVLSVGELHLSLKCRAFATRPPPYRTFPKTTGLEQLFPGSINDGIGLMRVTPNFTDSLRNFYS